MRCRRTTILPLIALMLLLSPLAGPGDAEAQTCAALTQPPWPNGCSVPGLPLFAANGLNLIFLGACNQHDQCWATCNGPNPPYNGLGHKAQCDLAFLAQMEAACVIWSGLLAYPGSGWASAGDFLDDCTQVAATFSLAVNTPPGFNIYWRSQCCRGCNPTGCSTAVPPLPMPFLCGNGQCYGSFPIPPRPIPPPFPCPAFQETLTWVIDSNGQASLALQQLDFDLATVEGRPESTVYLEEWAVVASDGGRQYSPMFSSEEFRARISSTDRSSPVSVPDGDQVLIVEAPVHPHNVRFAPTASLVPFAAPLRAPQSGAAQQERAFWFRAEVDTGGTADEVSLLDAALVDEAEGIRDTLLSNLQLTYVDDRRHRSVVYGRGTLSSDGIVEVGNGLVVTSMCCGDCCYDPEFDEWHCPCPF